MNIKIKKIRVYIVCAALFSSTVAILVFLYFVTIVLRGLPLYPNLNANPLKPMDERGGLSVGKVFDFNPAVGLVGAKNGRGAFLVARGEPVPVWHDKHGFRVTEDQVVQEEINEKTILFLGDSFSYGQLVLAEDSFAYISAEGLGASALNAAVPGHGLSSMVLQARKFIPDKKPDYVVIQYSPWLVSRALSDTVSGTRGLVKSPYFFERKSGAIDVYPPPFSPSLSMIERMERYKFSAVSNYDRASFIYRVAIPSFIKRDFDQTFYNMMVFLGRRPELIWDAGRITDFSYKEISDIAISNGAEVYILLLGFVSNFSVPLWLFPEGARVIDAHSAMIANLDTQTESEYVSRYFHFRGEPPEPVDGHPNEDAHKVIAEAILTALSEE